MNETVKPKPWSVRHPLLSSVIAVGILFAAGLIWGVAGPWITAAVHTVANFVATRAQV